MNSYSFKENLTYMAMAFFRPKSVLEIFLKGISFLYSIVPLIIFTIFYEILYILGYLYKAPVTPFVAVFHIPALQYNFYQIFLFPIVHVADFFIFGGLIYVGSRLLQMKIDTIKTVFFFVFIFNTIGLVSAVTDALSFVWESHVFMYVHPITSVVFFVYLTFCVSYRIHP